MNIKKNIHKNYVFSLNFAQISDLSPGNSVFGILKFYFDLISRGCKNWQFSAWNISWTERRKSKFHKVNTLVRHPLTTDSWKFLIKRCQNERGKSSYKPIFYKKKKNCLYIFVNFCGNSSAMLVLVLEQE